MNLEPYGYAIGISDILDWRECPARFERGMIRHTAEGEAPEKRDWTNVFGSAIHAAAHLVETQGVTNSEAIQAIWPEYGPWLGPEEMALLDEDLDCFRRRTALGVRLLIAEQDMRVPLFVTPDGIQVYFRFKVDQLYQHLQNPGLFLHRDLKSSRWRKTDAEVHSDLQAWAYNWGIHEVFPECQRLTQLYDQLRFGVVPTSKNAEQRAQIKEWLILNVKAIMATVELKPKQNEWCAYCSLVSTCSESVRATHDWKAKLDRTSPLIREGRTTRLQLPEEEAEIDRLIRDELPAAVQTMKHLKVFVEKLRGMVLEFPPEERQRLGWRMKERSATYLDPTAMAAMHEAMGPVFYELAGLSKTAVESYYGKPKKGEIPPPELALFNSLGEKITGATYVVHVGEDD